MKRITRMPVFLTGACAALLLIVAIPRKRADDPAPAPAPEYAPPEELLDTSADEGRIAEQRVRSNRLTWGRDPFRPPSEPQSNAAPPPVLPGTDGPQLTGISHVGDKRMAIIDREIVQRGDLLASGHEVLEIADATVTLMLDEEELILSLGDER